MPDFVHLHTHTEYSLLDGLSKSKALAQHAADLGMKALAITDHGVMYGVVDFYKACKAVDIKPIIGFEAYMSRKACTRREKSDGKPYHIVLLAQNQTGYQNLLALASDAQLKGFYYKPRIDKELLAKHSAGLIALSACVGGEIMQLLHAHQPDQAREAVRWYQDVFPDRFYIELQTHELPEFDDDYRQIINLAHKLNVPLVATNDIHYTRKDQAEAHDILLCIGTSKTVNDPKRMRMTDASYYMRSPEEMWELYKDIPEALENTVKIAEQCHVELQFAPPYHLPKFPVPEGVGTSQDYLRSLCDEGMKWRYGDAHDKPEYVERLEYELGIIHEMGFDDYFLIVWDLCIASQKMDIWWNVRGSGAGSVVAYTLNITNVDPFKNRLMFERFLNPGRVSMPDIDLDYPDDRREELIAYTKERYGADQVSAIITFGTLGARAAIRDVGRALDIPLSEVDRVARLIPNAPGKPVSIAQALATVPDLKEIYNSTPYIKRLLDTAEQLEGVTRHASTHAAGILISDSPLVEYLPLNRPTKGDIEDSPVDRVSQWPMEIVDAMGMLKVDFLGLRTLTHMRKACQLIENEHGRKLDLTTIPYERYPDDPVKDADVLKLYDLLSTGETTGIFQVEGAGMRRVLRDLRPERFQHIIAVLALYRPGPLENIPTYIKRMHGEEEVQYHHPILEDILDDTYGIIVYQEQIMQIAVAMAGYKPGEADMIRKAVAKKVTYLMEKHKKMFRKGSVERGIPAEVADRVWADIEFFARYGFNRAHATDYAVITAQTAYLKAHYPLEFMTALMTTERHNIEKLGFLIMDARRTGIEVQRPCINRSDVEFTIEHDAEGTSYIRIGLGAIKNVGDEAMQVLVAAREAKGAFKSLDDLADRVDLRKLNRKTMECLVQAGAFDDFGARPALLAIVDAMIGSSAQIHSAREVGQFTLFGDMAGMTGGIQLPKFAPPIADRKLLDWEKELLGTYLAKHPLTDTENELRKHELINTTIAQLDTESPGQQLTLVGMVQRLRKITTKKGDMMAFVTMEGTGGAVDLVVFPRTYERFKGVLVPERILVVCGKLDARPDRDDHPLLVDWFKAPEALLNPVNNSPYAASGFGAADDAPFSDDAFAPAPLAHDPFGDTLSNGTPPMEMPSLVSKASVRDARSRGNGEPAPQINEVVHDYRPDRVETQPPVSRVVRRVMPPPLAQSYTPPPPPEEQPMPSIIYITLHRSGDTGKDFRILAQLHHFLKAERGQDQFFVVLEDAAHKQVELSFPNEHTRVTPQLRKNVASLVGRDNLHVVASML